MKFPLDDPLSKRYYLFMDKIKYRLLQACTDMISNMRRTADQLEAAVKKEDFYTIAEIQMSSTSWTLDAIRGAARALVSFDV